MRASHDHEVLVERERREVEQAVGLSGFVSVAVDPQRLIGELEVIGEIYFLLPRYLCHVDLGFFELPYEAVFERGPGACPPVRW